MKEMVKDKNGNHKFLHIYFFLNLHVFLFSDFDFYFLFCFFFDMIDTMKSHLLLSSAHCNLAVCSLLVSLERLIMIIIKVSKREPYQSNNMFLTVDGGFYSGINKVYIIQTNDAEPFQDLYCL